MKIKPFQDNVLIKEDEKEEETASGILLTKERTEVPVTGKVIDTGPDVEFVKKGDRVFYYRYAPVDIELEGERMILVREEDVLAILK